MYVQNDIAKEMEKININSYESPKDPFSKKLVISKHVYSGMIPQSIHEQVFKSNLSLVLDMHSNENQKSIK